MIQKKVNLFRIIPLIIFFSLILLAFIALKSYDKDNIPSVLIGQSPPPLLLEELGNFKLLDKRDLEPIKENILNNFSKSKFLKKITKRVANLGLN